ncbi:cation transporter, partial [Xanthomonas vesicatoria]
MLAYTTPDLDQNGRMLWATVTFLVMMLAYTVVSIPYSALSGVITADSKQRTGLISLRFIGAFAGTTLVNYFTMDLV